MSQPTVAPSINEDKLNAFMGKVVGDFGAALSSSLAYIGQKLGLYKAMAGAGPVTAAELAARTGTVERYVREWLINQAAGGYVEYEPATGRYILPPEQAVALTDETSPFFVGGGFYVVKAMTQAQNRIEKAFLNGGGMLWGEHDPDLFVGTERFFRPGYTAHLIAEWIPALKGAEAKLKKGAKVADVGCGHGASTIIMAKAFPNSEDGNVLIVEPMAGNNVEENINPIGRTFSAASTLCCTPNSLALGGPGLGAVATEKALGGAVRAGGFPHFRRATETPFNRVFEARRTA